MAKHKWMNDNNIFVFMMMMGFVIFMIILQMISAQWFGGHLEFEDILQFSNQITMFILGIGSGLIKSNIDAEKKDDEPEDDDGG